MLEQRCFFCLEIADRNHTAKFSITGCYFYVAVRKTYIDHFVVESGLEGTLEEWTRFERKEILELVYNEDMSCKY